MSHRPQAGPYDRDQRMALAVAWLIAGHRGGGEVHVVRIPEEEDRTRPAVELETTDDVGSLVIEHTQIEPYSNHIGENHRIREYAEGILPSLAGHLPANSSFQLLLSIGAIDGVKPTPAVLDAIKDWIESTAATLVEGGPHVDGRHIARIAEPIEMALIRWPQAPGSIVPPLTVGRWAPSNLRELRLLRLTTALGKKLPKLTAAAASGAERVLLLESADLVLSNSYDIAEALREAARSFTTELPDWIVLWEQHASNSVAQVWWLRHGSRWIEAIQPVAVPAVP